MGVASEPQAGWPDALGLICSWAGPADARALVMHLLLCTA